MRITPLLGSLAALLLLAGYGADSYAQTAAPAVSPPEGGYSAAQLYNSANAYARSGNSALAVLGYERARVLAPTDADLRWNLHRVRESAGLPEDNGWFEEYGRFANPNTLYWIGVAGLVLGGVCVLALRFRAPHRGAFSQGRCSVSLRWGRAR